MQNLHFEKIEALCPVFGECGGCLYQDIPYFAELQIKTNSLKEQLKKELNLEEASIEPAVASPEEYHYRHRLDLGLRKIKSGEVLIGFVNPQTRKLIEINECAIARKEVSNFIPELKVRAKALLPADYKRANLTVKTGEEGRVLWGGIGKGSHRLAEEDYLWMNLEGQKIFYSLDNFFQANHFILPALVKILKRKISWNSQTVFFDLYGGVGLFSMVFAPLVKKVILIEESAPSIQMARFNANYHGFSNFEIYEASVENCLDELLLKQAGDACVAIVDPPRKGLTPQASTTLSQTRSLSQLLYLSCNPESLARDLKVFLHEEWKIEKIIPFDFFPRTKHLEVLALLKK